MKIYFAAAVSGGMENLPYYERIVTTLKRHGCEIPTEHIGNPALFAKMENNVTDEEICERCLSNWIPGCKLMIAEVTRASIGVGYEIAYALGLGIPVVCFYRPSALKRLSPMLTGNKNVSVVPYESADELGSKIEDILKKVSL